MPSGNTATPTGTPTLNEVYARLVTAMNRVIELEARVQRLEGALRVSGAGDVEIVSTGQIRLNATRQLVLEGGQQGAILRDNAGNSLTLQAGAVTLNASSKFQINASTIHAATPMARFNGVVRCDTIIANSVVGSSYTPGSGNVW